MVFPWARRVFAKPMSRLGIYNGGGPASAPQWRLCVGYTECATDFDVPGSGGETNSSGPGRTPLNLAAWVNVVLCDPLLKAEVDRKSSMGGP